jgi:murein DD-endopeptidase MepM/ murein hydrolase activator NlpD
MAGECFAVITVNAANVRARPQASANIVGILYQDARVPAHEVSEPDADNYPWIKVTIPQNNALGWVRSDLAMLSGNCSALDTLSTTVSNEEGKEEDEETTLAAQPDPKVLPGDCRGTVRAARANLRSGPELSSAAIGTVSRGTSFAVEEISENDELGFRWYRFDYNGSSAWIREDLVDETGDCFEPTSYVDEGAEEEQEEETPVPEPDTTVGCFALIQLSVINVRSEPTARSQLAGQAQRGERYAVQKITDVQPDGFTWIKVDFKGQPGFIRSDLAALTGQCSDFTNDDRLPRPAGARVTQGFRPPSNPSHAGLDFGTALDTELWTAIPGKIVRAHSCENCTATNPNIVPSTDAERQAIFRDPEWGWGYGHHIIIAYDFDDLPRSTQSQILRMGGKSTDSVFVLYAHLNRMDVRANDQVAANTLLGLSGHTGYSTGPHLHLEVAFGSSWGGATKINPNLLYTINI